MGNCTNKSFDDETNDSILFTVCYTGLVSFFMCLLAISILCYLKLYKQFLYRLALYQVISSMDMSIVDILSVSVGSYAQNKQDCEGWCIALAFFRSYAEWMKLLFTFFLVYQAAIHWFPRLAFVQKGCSNSIQKKQDRRDSSGSGITHIPFYNELNPSFHWLIWMCWSLVLDTKRTYNRTNNLMVYTIPNISGRVHRVNHYHCVCHSKTSTSKQRHRQVHWLRF